VVLEALTKYIAQLLAKGGALITQDEQLYGKFVAFAQSIGAVLGPHEAFLILTGLRTLGCRMPVHTRNARAIVRLLQFLGVTEINWPGYGGVVSFHHKDAEAIVARARLFLRATNFGGPDSLVSQPSVMTNVMLENTEAATPPDLVRVWCGLEDSEDLVWTLYHAMVDTDVRLRLLEEALDALRKRLKGRHVRKARIEEVLKSAAQGETVPELDSLPELAYAVWLNTD
jgi:cystathionine gamma-synthase